MHKNYKIIGKTYEDIIGTERGWIVSPGINTKGLMGLTLKEAQNILGNEAIIKEIKHEDRSNS